jgi:hypothetical protein
MELGDLYILPSRDELDASRDVQVVLDLDEDPTGRWRDGRLTGCVMARWRRHKGWEEVVGVKNMRVEVDQSGTGGGR